MDNSPFNLAVMASCYPRASDTFIHNEVAELRRLGFRVSTFSVRKPEKGHLVSAEIEDERQNTHYILGRYIFLIFPFFFFLFRHPISFLKALGLAFKTCPHGVKAHIWQIAYFIEACRLARWLKRLRIDHLHNHNAESSGTVALLASKLSGVPYSLSVHGPGIFYHPRRWALGEKIGHAAFIRCISHFCKSQCMAFSDRRDWEKLCVIHCSTKKIFLSKNPPPLTHHPKFLSIGRMEPIKGHLFLLEAAAKLKQEGHSFELVIIGDGPLRNEIEKNIQSQGLQDHVQLLGWVGSEKVKDAIIASRAVVSASFNEGIPIVLMEALSLGRPVISPSISGIPELVCDTMNGYLYPTGSLEGLVEAMKKVLLADPSSLEDMGKKGIERIQKHFNVEVEVGKLAQRFREGRKSHWK